MLGPYLTYLALVYRYCALDYTSPGTGPRFLPCLFMYLSLPPYYHLPSLFHIYFTSMQHNSTSSESEHTSTTRMEGSWRLTGRGGEDEELFRALALSWSSDRPRFLDNRDWDVPSRHRMCQPDMCQPQICRRLYICRHLYPA